MSESLLDWKQVIKENRELKAINKKLKKENENLKRYINRSK